ncbi:flagellar protein FliS [Enterococcus faecium]|uniref:Flagellar protein FliS n=1 Tax=Enterococcus faecium TaxID=1352 RepID=A0A7V7GPE6_ENTFC|nr:flagellar protein FliS [Enterococcus faecium]KAA0690053.1 flagellar protein FliS [Enterococcus faecium]MBK5027360.1 flagellar protein FliS [Enterococcus faecium]MBK5037899.1 flagellar protein FliS [Enterococcus faecium]MBK5042710.1 flagellar protein FliS [Enterococcus faecium]MBK5068214.1 flagellar protein FliS [Enterococcus faecium]
MDGNNAAKDKEVELTERGFLYLAKSTPRILLFAVKSLYRIGRGTINLVRKKSFRETIKSLPRVPIVMFKLLYNARTRSIDFVEKLRGKQKEVKQENKKNVAVQKESQTQNHDLKGKTVGLSEKAHQAARPTFKINAKRGMARPRKVKKNIQKVKTPEITVNRNFETRELGSASQKSGTKAERNERTRSNKATRSRKRQRSLREATAFATKEAKEWNKQVLNERKISAPSLSR